MFVKTCKPPYYAVIFTSTLKITDEEYFETNELLIKELEKQDGYLGHESARDSIGITVSYWKDMESIKSWRNNKFHKDAQAKGKSKWYSEYAVRIAKVEHDYSLLK